MAGGLAPSRIKATSLVSLSAAPPALRPALGVAFWVGIAEQRAEQAQPRPGASELQVARAHTSKEGASWQPGSTQHAWQGSECPAGHRDPSLCLFPTRQGQFWIGQSLGPMQKSGSRVPVTSCFLLLDLKDHLSCPQVLAGMELLQPGTATPSRVTHKGTAGP